MGVGAKGLRRRLRRALRALRPAPVPGSGELVAIDLETSSLDVGSAVILSIAAVPVRGRRVMLSERFERTVCAAGPIDREAVKFHRLRPVDVAHGVSASQAAGEFVAWLASRPVIGYCTGFDCAMLERTLRAAGQDSFDADCYDLRDLYRRTALRRNPDDAPAQSLDAMLLALGVPVFARHTALGDATGVALAFLALRGHER
jgi:DNA polymerase-3 subunit epsilon